MDPVSDRSATYPHAIVREDGPLDDEATGAFATPAAGRVFSSFVDPVNPG
jgi:hypothetical protein